MKNTLINLFSCYILLMLSLQIVSCNTQRIKINKYDKHGRKSGIWLSIVPSDSNNDNIVRYINIWSYTEGKLNGPYFDFAEHVDGSVELCENGSYKNDLLDDYIVYYYYGQKGSIAWILSHISINTDFKEYNKTTSYTMEGYKTVYQAYSVEFRENGSVSAEGWCIFGDDDYIANGWQIGDWKFYDESGNCTKETYDYETDSIKVKEAWDYLNDERNMMRDPCN